MGYHYTESGLDYVWLENGFTFHKTSYGEGVSIDDNEGLHQAIGRWLINAPKAINGAEFRFIRLEMELTQKSLAAIINAEEQTIRRWEKDRKRPIPGTADFLVRALFAEFLKTGSSVRRMVDRLAELNQIEVDRISFKDTDKGWQPEAA